MSATRSFLYAMNGAFSCSMSGSVVLVGLMNPKLMLDPSKIFSHLIWLISLTDLLGSVSLTLGIPHNSSTIPCETQAFLYTFFFPASWMYTLFLVFQLRCVLIYNKVWIKMPLVHFLVWTVAALCSFVPLSTNHYGQDDSESGFLPCNYGGDRYWGWIWGVATFSVVIYGVVVLMLLYIAEVNRYWARDGVTASPKQVAVYKATRLYPLAMCICWVPYVSVALVPPLWVTGSPKDWYYEMCLFASSQYGTLIAIIFFTHTPTVVRKIKIALNLMGRNNNNEVDDTVRLTMNAEEMEMDENFDDDDDIANLTVNDGSPSTSNAASGNGGGNNVSDSIEEGGAAEFQMSECGRGVNPDPSDTTTDSSIS